MNVATDSQHQRLNIQQHINNMKLDSFQPQMYTDEDGNKVIIEFRENEDGKKVKVRLLYRKTRDFR